jgi:macrolide transport system ATP-binding/permease protein
MIIVEILLNRCSRIFSLWEVAMSSRQTELTAPLCFNGVAYYYTAMANPLLMGISFHCDIGWTGVVGANGTGKTTLLKLATGLLSPINGVVQGGRDFLWCPQCTDIVPPAFKAFLETDESLAYAIRSRLGVEDDWIERWGTLSHGERKRAQIATLLWRDPPGLAIDEPTNHIDMEARQMLADALLQYRGVGLLVSHDRELLDRLCYQCLFIDPPGLRIRPGGYSSGLVLEKADEERATVEREQATEELTRLERTAAQYRHVAARSHVLRSKRGLALKDHDARFKLNRARWTGRDGVSGRRLNQMEGRIRQVREKKDSVRVKKRYRLGIAIPSTRCRRDLLFHLEAGAYCLGEHRTVRHPALTLRPGDRVAITGPNGSGKSTLIDRIVASLDFEAARLTYLPQEIAAKQAKIVLEEVKKLGNERRGRIMTIIRRLGSHPARLLESEQPSPGEVRKLLLALGMEREPYLIIADEPTNHLDLPSIICLEDALADTECGLLLVSHDMRFLCKLSDQHWNIKPSEGGGIVELC